MKALTNAGLTKLIQLIKANFISNNDTESTTLVDIEQTSLVGVENTSLINIDNTPTLNSTNLITSGGVYNGLESKVSTSQLLNLIYPIGSIYETSDSSFNPSTTWGGTWSRIKGKVLVGVDEDDSTFASAGLTGGEKAHTLTSTELASHNHTFTGSAVTSGTPSTNTSGSPSNNTSGTQSANHTHTWSGSQSHYHTEQYGGASWVDGSGLGPSAYGNTATWAGASTLKANITASTTVSLSGTTSANSANHTHSLQSHTHTLSSHTHSVTASGSIGNSGGGTSHNNLQPYETVYIWKRTA